MVHFELKVNKLDLLKNDVLIFVVIFYPTLVDRLLLP